MQRGTNAGTNGHWSSPANLRPDGIRNPSQPYFALATPVGQPYASVSGDGASRSDPAWECGTGVAIRPGLDHLSQVSFEQNGQAAGGQAMTPMLDLAVHQRVHLRNGHLSMRPTHNERHEHTQLSYDPLATESEYSYPDQLHQADDNRPIDIPAQHVPARVTPDYYTFVNSNGASNAHLQTMSTQSTGMSLYDSHPYPDNLRGTRHEYRPRRPDVHPPLDEISGGDCVPLNGQAVEAMVPTTTSQRYVQDWSQRNMNYSNDEPWSSLVQTGAPPWDFHQPEVSEYRQRSSQASRSGSSGSNQRSSKVYSDGIAESEPSNSNSVEDMGLPQIAIHCPPTESATEESCGDGFPPWTPELAQDRDLSATGTGQLSSGTTSGGSESSSSSGCRLPNILMCLVDDCGARFTGRYRKGNYARHRRQYHGGHPASISCEEPDCQKSFKRKDARLKHYRKHHPQLAVPAVPRGGDAHIPNVADWTNGTEGEEVESEFF